MENGCQSRGANSAPSFVDPGHLYTLVDVKSRMGWRDSAFRAAVRAGLKIYRSGKRTYVLGTDLVAFVTKAKEGDR